MNQTFKKVAINTLKIGDKFCFLGSRGVQFKVGNIKDRTIFYYANGKEFNCRYDECNVNKIN